MEKKSFMGVQKMILITIKGGKSSKHRAFKAVRLLRRWKAKSTQFKGQFQIATVQNVGAPAKGRSKYVQGRESGNGTHNGES